MNFATQQQLADFVIYDVVNICNGITCMQCMGLISDAKIAKRLFSSDTQTAKFVILSDIATCLG